MGFPLYDLDNVKGHVVRDESNTFENKNILIYTSGSNDGEKWSRVFYFEIEGINIIMFAQFLLGLDRLRKFPLELKTCRDAASFKKMGRGGQ